MSGNRIYWPLVNLDDVSADRRMQVYIDTAPYNHLFDVSLTDEEDFTIRAIVQLMLKMSINQIDTIMANSLHTDRIKAIRHLILSQKNDERICGFKEMEKFISEYNQDMKAGY